MQESTSKEKILKKVRNALIQKNDSPYSSIDNTSDVFSRGEEGLDINFAKQFINAGGNFMYCESLQELSVNLSELLSSKSGTPFCAEGNVKEILGEINIPYTDDDKALKDFNVGITGCEYLIARTGTIMMSSAKDSGRRLPAFSTCHIIIASSAQLTYDLGDAIDNMKKKYEKKLPSMISAITGPSRTADIEKTLIIGAHGPKEIYLYLLDGAK